MPRLPDFTSKHPEIEFNLQHFYHLPDFRKGQVDIAVLWGEGELPNLTVERLLPAPYTIVCSPRLLAGPHPIRELSDINHHQLMHISDYSLWERWRHAAAAPIENVRRGLVTDNQGTLTEAIVAGQGIGLAVEYLVRDHLASGKLVRPFELNFDLGYAYRLVYLPDALERPSIRSFRNWIINEASTFEQQEQFPPMRPESLKAAL
jgi:LysR family glycine cleavage system transcriptional activator